MSRTVDEQRIAGLTINPRPANSRPAFTMILPTSPQVPTPNREFLLETPTEGVSHIATMAKLAGWQVKIRDLRMGEDFEDACQDAAQRGGVVAMPTFIDSYPVNLRVLNRVRELNPAVTTLIGGALVSSLPEPLIRCLQPDYTILGEGEATLLELLDHIENGGTPATAQGIAGLGLLLGGKIHFTAKRKQLMDLDVLPIPDLFLFPSVQRDPVIPELGLTTSRGCYGRCSFCFLNMDKLSYKSPERFEREVAELVGKHQIRYFYVNDLTFTSNIERTYRICDVLKKYNLTWTCSTRVEKIKPELLRYMHDCGCRDIWYGVESVDQTVLDLADKATKVEEIEYAVTETVKAGIKVAANLIVGLPGESEESLRKMMEFCRNSDVIPISIKYLTPFPGTKIYDMAVEKGYISDPLAYLESLAERKVNDPNDAIINLTDLPEPQLREAFAELLEIRKVRLKEFVHGEC
ncbi:putative methyltransferase [Geobacter sp. OR-1]|uniref:B12-binding domain-containing radical SAM protein n=1 Tax=Geobacter sp. OR-1 TaxID=1266765 RepID=UPI0005439AC5|nr:radical SAM protein [Geobacter sp. OR-1]GAM09268.1 putative methyltransferase [Geobacter sp. OR-1]